MDFGNLAQFAAHIIGQEIATLEALGTGLEVVAKHIEDTAKDEIGQYQAEVGPFPAWAPLADSTEAEKERLGFPLEAPLLRTGDLRESIRHEVSGLEAVIGSDSDVMVYHEFGTSKMPPRPVIGPAAVRSESVIKDVIGAATVAGLTGGLPITRIGYDRDVR